MFWPGILTVFLSAGYAAVLCIVARGFKRLQPGVSSRQPPVTVMVAARNEAACIATCLEHLLRQDYPRERLEIIIVDDRSSDDTGRIVRRFADRHAHLKFVRITERSATMAPKKYALDLAIKQAKGEIILTTDADCRPQAGWVRCMVRHFQPQVGMVAGYNPYETPENTGNLFQEMLALDYFAMAAVAAASAGAGFPMSCSGGNLAYRKSIYRECGGFGRFANTISGDDDLFMQHVHETTNWKIRYALEPETQAPTAPPATFRDFLRQRIRYASKGLIYRRAVTLTLTAVYLLNLLLVAAPFSIFYLSASPLPYLLSFGIKTMAESGFLHRAMRVFKTRFPLRLFLLTCLLHPVYIVVAGLAGQLLPFKWKTETHRPRWAGAGKPARQSYTTTGADGI